MLNIQKKLIKYNFNKGSNYPRYLVIHDTANTSNGANANAHYNYFNGGNRSASAHIFVDDSNIIQTVEFTDTAWHCGDGRGKNGIYNSNSIGIEICVNSDGSYDRAVQNTIELVKYLMRELGIPYDRVVRHYDASGKNCPQSMSFNSWEKWNWFKSQLLEQPKIATTTATKVAEGIAYCTVDVLNVRNGAGTNYEISGELNLNEKVTIVDRNGSWRKVRYYNAWIERNTEGWVNANYLKIDKDISSNMDCGVVIADKLNVRAGRGTNYEIWDTLKNGIIVELGEVKNGWYLVYYNNKKASGYVSAQYIKKISD